MKLSARSAAWLLPLLLTGCFHKTQLAQNQPLAPPIEDTPPPKPEPAPTNLAPPVVTIPEKEPAPQPTPPPEPVKKPPKHRKPANPNPQIASNAAVPAIGVLSTNDPPNIRQQTDASIESTEKALNGITRKLNDQEQKIAAQIREDIKEAREALTSGDVDGARGLAVKAKVLLDELHP
jgi:outer membrane biosynthesis protein TonB